MNDKIEDIKTLREFHNTYAQDFQKIEQNYIELIVAVISALSIYGYGLKEFLFYIQSSKVNPKEYAFILFTITTFGTNILLLIVYFVSNIKAYQARQLQIIVFQIEKALGVVRHTSKNIIVINPDEKVIPNCWNVCQKEYITPPEIYQFFKFVSAFLLAMGDIIYWELLQHYQFGLQDFTQIFSKEGLFLIGGIFLAFVLFANLKFRWGFILPSIGECCILGVLLGGIAFIYFKLSWRFWLIFLILCCITLYCIKIQPYSEKLKELCEYWYPESKKDEKKDC